MSKENTIIDSKLHSEVLKFAERFSKLPPKAQEIILYKMEGMADLSNALAREQKGA